MRCRGTRCNKLLPVGLLSRKYDDHTSKPFLPTEIIGVHIAPFLDRWTLNNLSLGNRAIYQVIQQTIINPPWPAVTIVVSKSYLPNERSPSIREHDHSFEARVLAVAVSPSGNIVACGTNYGHVHLWNSKTGKCIILLSTHRPHEANMRERNEEEEVADPVTSVAFSPDGETLGCAASCIHLWSIIAIPMECDNKSSNDISSEVPFDVSGNARLPFGQRYGSAYEVRDHRRLGQDTPVILSISFSPDSELVLSSRRMVIVEEPRLNPMTVWNVADGTCLYVFQPGDQNADIATFYYTGVFFSVMSEKITIKPSAIACVQCSGRCLDQYSIVFWNVSDLQSEFETSNTIHRRTNRTLPPPYDSIACSGVITCIALSSNGKYVSAGTASATILVWEMRVVYGIEKWMAIGEWDNPGTSSIFCIAASSNGMILATSSADIQDNTVTIWNTPKCSEHSGPEDTISEEKIITKMNPHKLSIWEFATMRGRFLETKTRSRTDREKAVIVPFPTQQGCYNRKGAHPPPPPHHNHHHHHRRANLEGHSGCVTMLAFSPNGQTVVSGSVDGTLRLWMV